MKKMFVLFVSQNTMGKKTIKWKARRFHCMSRPYGTWGFWPDSCGKLQKCQYQKKVYALMDLTL
jgi:hypothetical protein